jgi:hypothetical protein
MRALLALVPLLALAGRRLDAQAWRSEADTDRMSDAVTAISSLSATQDIQPAGALAFRPELQLTCTLASGEPRVAIWSAIAPRSNFESHRAYADVRFDKDSVQRLAFRVAAQDALSGWLVLSERSTFAASTDLQFVLSRLATAQRLLVRYELGTGEEVIAQFALPSDTRATVNRIATMCGVDLVADPVSIATPAGLEEPQLLGPTFAKCARGGRDTILVVAISVDTVGRGTVPDSAVGQIPPPYREEVVKAVRRTLFRPARLHGRPVSLTIRFPLRVLCNGR